MMKYIMIIIVLIMFDVAFFTWQGYSLQNMTMIQDEIRTEIEDAICTFAGGKLVFGYGQCWVNSILYAPDQIQADWIDPKTGQFLINK